MGACASKPATGGGPPAGAGGGAQSAAMGSDRAAGSPSPPAVQPKDVVAAVENDTDLQFNALLGGGEGAADTVRRDFEFVDAEEGAEPEKDDAARGVLNNLLHWSPYSLCVSDIQAEDQPLIYANEVFQEITGYHEHELVGRNCRFLQGPDSDPEVVAEMRRCINLGEEFVGEIINYSKDGRRLFNRLIMSPVRNKDGIVTHYTGIQRFTAADDSNKSLLVPVNDPDKVAAEKRGLRRRSAFPASGDDGGGGMNVELDEYGRVVPKGTGAKKLEGDEKAELALFGGGNLTDSAPIAEVSVQRRKRRQGGEVAVQADANIWLELVLRVLKFDATPTFNPHGAAVLDHIKEAGREQKMSKISENAIKERDRRSQDLVTAGQSASRIAEREERRTTVA